MTPMTPASARPKPRECERDGAAHLELEAAAGPERAPARLALDDQLERLAAIVEPLAIFVRPGPDRVGDARQRDRVFGGQQAMKIAATGFSTLSGRCSLCRA